MIRAELKGEYDTSRRQEALIVSDDNGQRIALFLVNKGGSDVIGVAVTLPESRGTRCYSIDFDWLLDHLRRLDPASPPTEAAAAVGGLLALALEIESRSFRDIIDDDLVRWSRQIKDAALSPTASAAREGL